MAEYETVTYDEANGVAWVTLNRPEVHEQALGQGCTWIAMGTDAEGLREGPESFSSGARQEWRLR